jgi:uncharacterized Fe-S cluster-containing radical SAM superfamily protein
VSDDDLTAPDTKTRTGNSLIETPSIAERMRSRIIDLASRRVLISRIAGSDQAQDLKVPANCRGLGRIRHFRRATARGWPANPLPIDPACHALGLSASDELEAQVFQNAACAWRCWYCYVPFELLAGISKLGAWISAEEIIDLYLAESSRPAVIDLTGGSPDLTPEWILWVMRALRARGMERSVYLWSDDNLSTDYLWRFLTRSERLEISSYPAYGRVTCFKGFDEASFAFNTHANPSAFDRQFELMARLIRAGIDSYCYATFTARTDEGLGIAMRKFVDRLQEIHPNLPLRTVPLHIETFSPMQPRVNDARQLALRIQDSAIAAWNEELARRFTSCERALPVFQVSLDRV